MPNDHYVAETYLKHFADERGLLHAYRKSDAKYFPTRPPDICHEPDGDIIPAFLSNPAYLGAFRGAFEPVWNHVVAALKARACTQDVKFHVAGYWANLLVCTPTWRRIGIELYNRGVQHAVTAHAQLSAKHGQPDEMLNRAVDALEQGRMTLQTEADYIRAHGAANVLKYAWALYNAEWLVVENDTDLEFVTSDNPAALLDAGGDWPTSSPFFRILPITPRICITSDLSKLDPRYRDQKAQPDFKRAPAGTVKGAKADANLVGRLNAGVASCAEDLVLSCRPSEYVRDLAARHAKHHLQVETTEFEQGGAYYFGGRIRAIGPEQA
jgi:Protein of unknown function (DUF4238)